MLKLSPEKRKELELNKLNEETLYELCDRQKAILKNKKLTEKLPDKGEQIQRYLEKIENEIKYRKDLKDIEDGIKNINVVGKKSDHIEHICKIEKPPKERYKPFLTLINHQITSKETKLIPLEQSMDLLTKQTKKMKETISKINESDSEDTDEESDKSYHSGGESS